MPDGANVAEKWAGDEARASVNRTGKLVLVLALVLLLGAFLSPNPAVNYTMGSGHTIGASGWSGLIPPFPPSSGLAGTLMNWVAW